MNSANSFRVTEANWIRDLCKSRSAVPTKSSRDGARQHPTTVLPARDWYVDTSGRRSRTTPTGSKRSSVIRDHFRKWYSEKTLPSARDASVDESANAVHAIRCLPFYRLQTGWG